ncbi:M64 family metallopeptidase [Colwelliaceae bacterium 6441]
MKIIFFVFIVIGTISCGGGGSTNSGTKNNGSIQLPLSISGTPVLTAIEDETYSFQTLVSNGSGGYSYSIENAPSWLSISSSGLVSGTPLTDADTGTFTEIIVSVTDSAQNTASLTAFNLDVTAVNDAPRITVNTSELSLESKETFNISYSVIDEENDNLQVSVVGLESAFNINILNTVIDGTVLDINEVVHGAINIVVTDSGGQSTSHEIVVNLFPVTDSGLGLTLVGSQNGPGIHLVILGDGYQESEYELYKEDVFKFINLLAADGGIAQHSVGWNVHLARTFSVESGADTNYGEDAVNTYFNSGYNCRSIQRLICLDSTIVNSLLLSEFPQHDQAVIIVNDSRYGGSGGQFSVYSRNSPQIALHEMGHSFANLADEYIDEALAESAANRYSEGIYANISANTDPNEVTWSHWIDDKNNYPTTGSNTEVGIFEGALYNEVGFYRPLSNSRMSSNNANFGVVSSEQWILSIYDTAGAVIGLFPTTKDVTKNEGDGIEFGVNTLFDRTIQTIKWSIDGVVKNELTDKDIITLEEASGTYSVMVSISDITGKIRKIDTSADFSYEWRLTVN